MDTTLGILIFGIMLAVAAWGWIAFIGILLTSRHNSPSHVADKDNASIDVLIGLVVISLLSVLAILLLVCPEELGA